MSHVQIPTSTLSHADDETTWATAMDADDPAMDADDPLSDKVLSDQYEQLAASGFPIENPFRLDEDEHDARLEAHTSFLRQYAEAVAQLLGRPLTLAEASLLRSALEARFGLDWAPSEFVDAALRRQRRARSRSRIERAELEVRMRCEALRRGAEAFERRRGALAPLPINWRPGWAQALAGRDPRSSPPVQFSRCGGAGRRPVAAHAPPAPSASLGPIVKLGPAEALAA
jgi:hypothetical protein